MKVGAAENRQRPLPALRPGTVQHLTAVTVVDEIELPIQVNGKVRDRLTVAVDADKEALEAQVLALPHIKEFIGDKKVVKFIVVPKKIINIVVK